MIRSTPLRKLFYSATLLVCAMPALAAPISVQSLLAEMADLERLSHLPAPAYTTGQFSSYDRKASDPAAHTDDNWFANADRGQHLRVEQRSGASEWVLMDAEGPGAVVRFWSANPDDGGVVRFYLDGADTPVIEMPLTKYLGAEGAPAPRPITGERARGWNSYLPIPYAKHCKITTSAPDYYYVVNYRTYAAGTAVESYTPDALGLAAAQLQETARLLAAPESAVHPPGASAETHPFEWRLDPGATNTLTLPAGPRMAGALMLRVTADDLEAALRGCLLEVRYDGASVPAIQAPLGDFFGTAPGPQPFNALPCGVSPDGTLEARWPMPFREALALTITNHTLRVITITGSMKSAPADVKEDRLYLHAKWRAAHNLPTRPRQDWNFAELEGEGRFVGTMLHVSNPVKAWWGEGDEKIYVDGAAFPNYFGTGSEDYFGYAWCSNETFAHAYHNQPRCDGPGNYGQTCVSRFHIMDDIPFTQSFRFDMEVWHWEDCTIGQSAITWWYAKAGGTDNFTAPTPETLRIPALPPPPAPKRVAGALEGESMAILQVTGGTATTQESDFWPWSNAAQLWWIDAAEGDRLVVGVDVPETGDYEVWAVFTRAPDYAVVQVTLGNEPPLPTLDLYGVGVAPTPEIALGEVHWSKGRQQITFEIVGRNPEAIPRHMVGLDYIRLVKRNPAPSE